MSTFLALYRGHTVADARLVAVSADPHVVADFAGRLLEQPLAPEDVADPVRVEIEEGRRGALRLVAGEGSPDAV